MSITARSKRAIALPDQIETARRGPGRGHGEPTANEHMFYQSEKMWIVFHHQYGRACDRGNSPVTASE
jgi:hypothetical protein